MSIVAYRTVWAAAAAGRVELTSTDVLVLAAMADFAADDGGRVFPTHATLAARTKLDDRTIRRTIKRLVNDLRCVTVARPPKAAR